MTRSETTPRDERRLTVESGGHWGNFCYAPICGGTAARPRFACRKIPKIFPGCRDGGPSGLVGPPETGDSASVVGLETPPSIASETADSGPREAVASELRAGPERGNSRKIPDSEISEKSQIPSDVRPGIPEKSQIRPGEDG